MWIKRERKPATVDIDHLRVLHQEAIEQLELLRTMLEAAEQASGIMQDHLVNISENHWHAYLDIVHMITLHDKDLAINVQDYGIHLRDFDDEYDERPLLPNRILLLLILAALLRRHQRLVHLWGLRGSPMTEYFVQSMAMEREHMTQLIAMAEKLI